MSDYETGVVTFEDLVKKIQRHHLLNQKLNLFTCSYHSFIKNTS
jgi:hypothetical protein